MTKLQASALVAAALSGILAAAPADASSPRGRSYYAHVIPASGPEFFSCLEFKRSGVLVIEGYGPVLYRFDELNDAVDSFQTAPIDAKKILGFFLTFHGSVEGAKGRTLTAEALNSRGNTFIIQGALEPNCAGLRNSAAREGAAAPNWE